MYSLSDPSSAVSVVMQNVRDIGKWWMLSDWGLFSSKLYTLSLFASIATNGSLYLKSAMIAA